MTEEFPQHEQWHLSKAVPVSIIFFLIAQTIGLIAWAVKLDARVGVLETQQVLQDKRLEVLELSRDKLILIEERQNNVMRVLDSNAKKIDQLIETLKK